MSGGFNNPIIGGGGALVYPSIHSPDFVGASPGVITGTNLTEWSILTGSPSNVAGLKSAIGYVAQGYAGNVNGVPPAWPGGGNVFPGGVQIQIMDFAPVVADVINGSLDTALLTYMGGAPAGSYLMAYHEVNSQANINQFGYTATQINQMDAHILALKNANFPLLKYGRGLSMFPVYSQGQDPTPWITPGMDFYGMDGYQANQPTRTPADVFSTAIAKILAVQSGAQIAMIETGTALDAQTWFDAIETFVFDNQLFLCQSFWGSQSNTQQWSPGPTGFATWYQPIVNAFNAGTAGQGWEVAKDGSAEFNDLLLRGTFDSPNAEINANGAFFYSGTPGFGDLLVAIAGMAGNDKFLNPYPGGLAVPSFAGGTTLTQLFGALRANTTGPTINGTGLVQASAVTVPAGTAVPGAVYRLTTWGNGTWNNGSGDTLIVQPSMGGSTAGGCTIGTVALPSGAFRWRIIQELTCISTGANATWLVAGYGSLSAFGANLQGGSASNSIPLTYGNTATITASSLIAQAMSLSLAWGAIAGSPSITVEGTYAERVA